MTTTSIRKSASIRDYYELTKPRVVMLIIFTAIVGMFLAVPGMPDLGLLVFGTVGIGLAASSAAVVNQVLDMRIDLQMKRTRNRPLPQGRVTEADAFAFAGFLCTASMLLLWFTINPLTAILTFASLIGYAVVYTVYLKRATPQNIVIGGAAGAAPPVLGWTAMTGELHSDAVILFLIIFAWTPPHFWALAIARKDEYAKVGIPMLPVTHGVEYTRRSILFYTVVLILITLMPYLSGMSGVIYVGTAMLLGGRFLWYALQLKSDETGELPMRMFKFSIIYLMYLFAALLLDHYFIVRIDF